MARSFWRRPQNNKNITSEQLHYAIKPNQQLSVRRAAIKNPNITSDHINKALDDPEQSVKIFAIEHKNATRENIHKALEDTDTDVYFAIYKVNLKTKKVELVDDNQTF